MEDEQAAMGAKHEKAIRALNAKLEDLGGQLAIAEAGWAAAESACIAAQREAATARARAAGKQRECCCQDLGFTRTLPGAVFACFERVLCLVVLAVRFVSWTGESATCTCRCVNLHSDSECFALWQRGCPQHAPAAPVWGRGRMGWAALGGWHKV